MILNAVAGQVKKFIPDASIRDNVIHGVIFVGALGYTFYQHPVLEWSNVANAVGYLALAIGTYEVLLKRLGNSISAFGSIF